MPCTPAGARWRPSWPSGWRRPAAPSPRAATPRSWRGRTTIPEATRDRLGESGVRVRNLPGRPLLRASVGAWNDESDLERLLAAL